MSELEGLKGTVQTKTEVLLLVHRTVLELHSETESQRSAEQLKQLEILDVSEQLVCCDQSAGEPGVSSGSDPDFVSCGIKKVISLHSC